jgi:hypothetical protein
MHKQNSGIFVFCFTEHLGIILIKEQRDAQFSFLICLFQLSTCFDQPSAHHQENQSYQYNVWYMSLCVGDLHDNLHRVTYTRRCIDTTDSPDDEH